MTTNELMAVLQDRDSSDGTATKPFFYDDRQVITV